MDEPDPKQEDREQRYGPYAPIFIFGRPPGPVEDEVWNRFIDED